MHVHVYGTTCKYLNPSSFQSSSLPRPHGFTTGTKLEAVNPNDPSSICAATVSKVASEFFFQVEIDSTITCGDGSRPSIWCSSNSRNIFPVGWCEKNNIQLTPPPGRAFFLTKIHLVIMIQWKKEVIQMVYWTSERLRREAYNGICCLYISTCTKLILAVSVEVCEWVLSEYV